MADHNDQERNYARACREAEAHASSCAACRQDLANTRLTLDALSTLREEDPPRRIAFVSDKVFEPRWWRMFWTPSFAGALLIAVAILVHAFARPAGAVDQKQIQAMVVRAVSEAQTRYEQQLVADYEEAQKQQRLEYIRNAGLVRQ